MSVMSVDCINDNMHPSHLMPSCLHKIIRSYAHTLIRSYVHTFIRSYVHTFMRSLGHELHCSTLIDDSNAISCRKICAELRMNRRRHRRSGSAAASNGSPEHLMLPLPWRLNHGRRLNFPATRFANAKLATDSQITDELELIAHIERVSPELVV